MTAKWGICVFLAAFLALAPGCRTPRPDLRPKDLKKEELTEPPAGQYNVPEYPKQAFAPLTDPSKVMGITGAGGVPGRGGMGGMGGQGMNGMR